MIFDCKVILGEKGMRWGLETAIRGDLTVANAPDDRTGRDLWAFCQLPQAAKGRAGGIQGAITVVCSVKV